MSEPSLPEESIFAQALEIAPAERAAFLGRACGENQALRAEVEALLRANERSGDVLDLPENPAATIDEAPTSERPGTVIGPYKLLQQIGEGGMGTVFMAEQTHPVQRKVALKVIKAGMDSRQVIARFEAERQALAMMDHVNIARVFDASATEAGRPYFVMELVHGIPITKYCDDNHLTPRERLELFVPVCQAIQHAHQKGIIHRDVKPSNVMITLYDGKPVPKVIDFGVAKATEQKLTERTLFTQYGTMVGTLEYMSPEQAELSALGVDTRSDIYSLGVLLYELLTGNTPLTHKRMKEAAYAEVLRMIKEEEPPKPSTRLSDSGEALASISAQRHTEPAKLSKLMRGELDWIVMKCLEKDRGRRYETANGFAADVQRYLNDETVQACPPSAMYRFRKFARRNKRVLATMTALALAVLVTMVALAVSNVLIKRETAQKEEALNDKTEALAAAKASEQNAKIQEGLAKKNGDQAETERRAAVAQEKIAKQEELTARHRFYAAQTNLAMQAWEGGDSARTLELLETQRPKFDQDDLRSFEWYYLWRLCIGGLRARLKGHPGTVYSVAFLPDGKTLASAGGGVIKLWDVATAHEKASWQSRAWALAISPDGKTLGSWGEVDPVRLWDPTSGKQIAVIDGTNACTFSPDGKTVAVTRGADVEFWDVAGRQRQSVLHVKQGGGRHDDTFRFAPDGKTALAPVKENLLRIYRWDSATWQEGSEIIGHGWFQPTTFSPDGKTFAVGGEVLKFYATDTGKELSTLAGHTTFVYSVAFSPDGKSLASGGGDRTLRVWDLATGKQRTSYPHPGPVNSVAYSPDGKSLASAGAYGTLRLWDTAPAEQATVLRAGGALFVAYSPDGKTLAISGSAPKLWDMATGQEAATLGSAGSSLAFSHDGKNLAITRGNDVELLDLATRKPYAVLRGHSKGIFAVAFAPDGKTVATGSYDKTARLWDTATRQPRVTIKLDRAISAVAFSPDGQTLATGSIFEYVELWDTLTGRERLRVQGHDSQGTGPWTWSVAFSPDGKTLAVASQTGIVRLWDPASGHLLAALQGHTAEVRCVAFSPDGKTLATASADRTVRLWDTATGQEKVTLKAHTAPVHALAFSRDGSTLATGSWDGTVRLWRASTEQEAKAFRTELDLDESDSPAALLDAADGLKTAGRTEEAYQAYDKASARLDKLIELKPDERRYWSYRASAYYELGKYDKAVADYSKAIELKPDNPRYWNYRSTAYLKLGQWDKALADCSKAIELKPAEAVYRSNRAVLYAEMRQWKEANANFAKAVELNEDNPYHDPLLRHRQALVRLPLGDVEGYRKLCADMLGRFDPAAKTLWTTWSDRGDALPKSEEEAKTDSALWAVWTCVLAADAVADWKVPLQLAETAVDDNPKSYRALNHHGAVLYRASKYKEALIRLTAAEAASQPDDKEMNDIAYNWLFLAMAHHRLGHIEEAQKWLTKAVQEIDRPMPEKSQAAPFTWSRRLTLQLLRREAEELLNQK